MVFSLVLAFAVGLDRKRALTKTIHQVTPWWSGDRNNRESTESGPFDSLPFYGSTGSAGADIRAFISRDQFCSPPAGAVYRTTSSRNPESCETKSNPRSGLAYHHSITVLNAQEPSIRIIEETAIILINLGNENFTISSGDRIAQLVIRPVVHRGLY